MWSPQLLQAIAAAIDREELVDRVFEGRNIPAYHMVPPDYPYATEPFLDRYGERDLDLAIELLTDLGYTADKPFDMQLWFPPEHYGTTTADVMQVLKEQIEATGLVKVTLNSQNWAILRRRLCRRGATRLYARLVPRFLRPRQLADALCLLLAVAG